MCENQLLQKAKDSSIELAELIGEVEDGETVNEHKIDKKIHAIKGCIMEYNDELALQEIEGIK